MAHHCQTAAAQAEKWVVGASGAKLYCRKAARRETEVQPYVKGWSRKQVSVPAMAVLETNGPSGGYLLVSGAPERAGSWVSDIGKSYFFVKKNEVQHAPDAFEAGAALKVSGDHVFGRDLKRDLQVRLRQGLHVKAIGFKDPATGLCLVSAIDFGGEPREYWVGKDSLARRGALTKRTVDDPPRHSSGSDNISSRRHSKPDRQIRSPKSTTGGKELSGAKWYTLGLGYSERKAVRQVQEAEGYQAQLRRGGCLKGDSYLNDARRHRRDGKHAQAEQTARMATNEYLKALAQARIDEAKRLSGAVPLMKVAEDLIRKAGECIRGNDGRGAYNRACSAVMKYEDYCKEHGVKAAFKRRGKLGVIGRPRRNARPRQVVLEEAAAARAVEMAKSCQGKMRLALTAGDKQLDAATRQLASRDFAGALRSAAQAEYEYMKWLVEQRIADAKQRPRQGDEAKEAQKLLAEAEQTLSKGACWQACAQALRAVERCDRIASERVGRALAEARKWQQKVGQETCKAGDECLLSANNHLDAGRYQDALAGATGAETEYQKHFAELKKEAGSAIAKAQQLQKAVGQGLVPEADSELAQAVAGAQSQSYAIACKSARAATARLQARVRDADRERDQLKAPLAELDGWQRFADAHHWPRPKETEELARLRQGIVKSYDLALLQQAHKQAEELRNRYMQYAQTQIGAAQRQRAGIRELRKRLALLRTFASANGVEFLASMQGSLEEPAAHQDARNFDAHALYQQWRQTRQPHNAIDHRHLDQKAKELTTAIDGARMLLLGQLSSEMMRAERDLRRAKTTKEGIFCGTGPHAPAIERTKQGLVKWATPDYEKGERLLKQLEADRAFKSWDAETFRQVRQCFEWVRDSAAQVYENTQSGPNFCETGATEAELPATGFLRVRGRVSRQDGDRRDCWVVRPAPAGVDAIRLRWPGPRKPGLLVYFRQSDAQEWQSLPVQWTRAKGPVLVLLDGTGTYEFETGVDGAAGTEAVILTEARRRRQE